MPFIDSKDFNNGEFFKKLPVSAPIFQSPMLLGYFKTFWVAMQTEVKVGTVLFCASSWTLGTRMHRTL